MGWNSTCVESIRKQKSEVAKRYNIRFGQTTMFCARCGSQWWGRQHLCQDLTLVKAREVRSAKTAQVESDKLAKKENLLQLRKNHQNILPEIQVFGIRKLATLLDLPKVTVKMWIKRGKVPNSRLKTVLEIMGAASLHEASQ